MLKKISNILQPFGLIATIYVAMYLVLDGENTPMLVEYLGSPENVKIAFYVALAFLVIEIPLGFMAHRHEIAQRIKRS